MNVSQKFTEVLTHECSHIIFSYHLTQQHPCRIQISPEYHQDSIVSWTGLVEFKKNSPQIKFEDRKLIMISLAGVAAETIFFNKSWRTLENETDNSGDFHKAKQYLCNYNKTGIRAKRSIDHYYQLASKFAKKWENNIITLKDHIMATETDPVLNGFEYFFVNDDISNLINK